jgi:hypothetical protein
VHNKKKMDDTTPTVSVRLCEIGKAESLWAKEIKGFL